MNNCVISMIKNIIITKNISLTGNEKAFLTFLENANCNDLNYTVEQISKISYVSKSTITRFSKKLGFSGFAELKYSINTINEEITVPDNKYINMSNSEVYSNYIKTLSNTRILSDEIKKLIDSFHTFNTIYIIGVGSSSLVSTEFAYILNNLNVTNVEALCDTYNQNLKSSISNRKNLLICLSISGKNHNVLDIANKFKKNNSVILGISCNESSPLKNLSDYFIQAPTYTNKTSKILPLLVIIDLISCYLKNNKL